MSYLELLNQCYCSYMDRLSPRTKFVRNLNQVDQFSLLSLYALEQTLRIDYRQF